MTDTTEQKALALVNEVAKEMGLVQLRILDTDLPGERALLRAIEQHEAFRQEVSDALKSYYGINSCMPHRLLAPFIIAKPDPLVEVFYDVDTGPGWDSHEDYIRQIRAAIEKRGGKIVWGEG